VQLRALVFTFYDSQPRFRHSTWKQAFESRTYTTPLQTLRDMATSNLPEFSLPLGEEREEWKVWLTEDSFWERFNTLSQISVLEGEERERTKSKFMEIMASVPAADRNEKGEIGLTGWTHAAWTSRV
jgi:hypothetical protein